MATQQSRLLLDSTGSAMVLILQEINETLKSQGSTEYTTWKRVMQNVQAGLGETMYPANNTKFTVYKCPNGSTKGAYAKYQIDVVGHNKHFAYDEIGAKTAAYSMTIQIHYLLPEMIQFDAKEVLYGLSLDESVVSWKTYYSDTSGTMVSSPAGSPKDNGYYEKNDSNRVSYGNSCWRTSAIRQWLNALKTVAAGEWWKKMHACDVAPSYADILPFQAMLAEDVDGSGCTLLDVVKPVSIDTIISTVKRPDATNYYLDCDGNGDYSASRLTYDTTEDTFFLPSCKEVYMASYCEPNGVILDYYEDNSSLTAASDSADTNRIKMALGATSATYWWLRSAGSGYSYYACLVSSSGAGSNYYAYNASGVAPLCVIY